jgi:hypothetical protein
MASDAVEHDAQPGMVTAGGPTHEATHPRRLGNLPGLGPRALRIGPALMLLVVVLVAAALSPVFFTTRNLGNVLSQTAVITILALAQLLVIVTRGIDLSVGSTLALSAVVGALVFGSVTSGPVVVLAMLATGTAVGVVNGVILVWGKLPHPFIMTLAMLSIARGLALWLSGGQPINGMPQLAQTIAGGADRAGRRAGAAHRQPRPDRDLRRLRSTDRRGAAGHQGRGEETRQHHRRRVRRLTGRALGHQGGRPDRLRRPVPGEDGLARHRDRGGRGPRPAGTGFHRHRHPDGDQPRW